MFLWKQDACHIRKHNIFNALFIGAVAFAPKHVGCVGQTDSRGPRGELVNRQKRPYFPVGYAGLWRPK
jgi:hypothetical protein